MAVVVWHGCPGTTQCQYDAAAAGDGPGVLGVLLLLLLATIKYTRMATANSTIKATTHVVAPVDMFVNNCVVLVAPGTDKVGFLYFCLAG